MGVLSAIGLGEQTRVVLLDMEGEAAAGLDQESVARLLTAARRQGLSVAHCYRSPNRPTGGGLSPLKGLSPLPNEPVFLRSGSNAFSDRRFAAWLGAAPGAVVFLGDVRATEASAATAAHLGHAVYLTMRSANSNGAQERQHEFYPYVASRVSAQPPEFARTVISYISRGANGPG
jgi:hypothetical protein